MEHLTSKLAHASSVELPPRSRALILGFKTGGQYWSSRLGFNTGLQYWSSILVFNTGLQDWGSILVFNTGLQYWSLRLGFKMELKDHAGQGRLWLDSFETWLGTAQWVGAYSGSFKTGLQDWALRLGFNSGSFKTGLQDWAGQGRLRPICSFWTVSLVPGYTMVPGLRPWLHHQESGWMKAMRREEEASRLVAGLLYTTQFKFMRQSQSSG